MSTRHPIGIVGAPRSGTTLLASILNAHPAIALPPEEGFVLRLAPRYAHRRLTCARVAAFLDDLFASETFQEWHLSREEIETEITRHVSPSYRGIVENVYSAFARRLGPCKVRWGLKEPYYVSRIEELLRVCPTMRIIHIVRDGRDVLLSMRDRERKGGNNKFETNVFNAALHWRAHVTMGRRSGADLSPQQYYEVRYEDLVADPSKTVQGICRFLCEDFDSAMLGFYGNVVANELLPVHELDQYLLPEVTTARVERWKTELGQDELAAYEAVAGTTLCEFGYKLQGSRPSAEIMAQAFGYAPLYLAYRRCRKRLRETSLRMRGFWDSFIRKFVHLKHFGVAESRTLSSEERLRREGKR